MIRPSLIAGSEVNSPGPPCGAGVGADVDDRLPGVEAFHEQQVGPGLGELPGLGPARDVDAQHAVTGVGVVHHVERAVMSAPGSPA